MLDVQYSTLYTDAFLADLYKVYDRSLVKFLQAANVPYVIDNYGVDFLDADDTCIPGTKYQINNFSYHLLIKFMLVLATEVKNSPTCNKLLNSIEFLKPQEGFDVKQEIDTANQCFTELYSQYDRFMNEIENSDDEEYKNESVAIIGEWLVFTQDITDILTRFFIKCGFIVTLNSSERYHCVAINAKDRLAINHETFLSEMFEFIVMQLAKTDTYQQESALMTELGFTDIDELLAACFGVTPDVTISIKTPHVLHSYSNTYKTDACEVNVQVTHSPKFTP